MDAVKVSGGGELPIRKILCLGRNYRAHAAEMGSDVPKEPVIFLKPSSSVTGPQTPVVLPRGIGRIDHEVELAVHLGSGGRYIAEADAARHIAAYSVALDLTARDMQAQAKKKGLPWTLSKGIDGFCPLSDAVPSGNVPDPHALDIGLTVNGEARQRSNTGMMVFSIPFVISYISRFMTLERGDIILTGTPEGVGPVSPGDRLHAWVSGVGELNLTAVEGE